MTARIGGRLDHRAMAVLHRPADFILLARAARDLAARGLTARDIAQALNLNPAAVVDLLRDDAA